jgi:hypothetical protein
MINWKMLIEVYEADVAGIMQVLAAKQKRRKHF